VGRSSLSRCRRLGEKHGTVGADGSLRVTLRLSKAAAKKAKKAKSLVLTVKITPPTGSPIVLTKRLQVK
jgi:hypothetical protein